MLCRQNLGWRGNAKLSSFLFVDGLVTIAVLGLVYSLANWFWKRQALARACEWAALSNMRVNLGSRSMFRMHRQTPRITFEAVEESGRRFRCTLELKATSFFSGPLDRSAVAELLEKTEM